MRQTPATLPAHELVELVVDVTPVAVSQVVTVLPDVVSVQVLSAVVQSIVQLEPSIWYPVTQANVL